MDSKKLALEIRCELEHFRQLAADAETLLAIPAEDRRPWDAVAAAKYVADLWLGFENLCKRRYAAMGKATPDGADSHMCILNDFLAEPALGGALPADVAVRLKKYLAFRHRFIHGYGQALTWGLVEERCVFCPKQCSLSHKSGKLGSRL